MIKRYSNTDMVWDSFQTKWLRKKKEIKKVVVEEIKQEKDFSKMGWREFLLHIYKECRNMENWIVLVSLHDEEDQQYFSMLDELRRKI